MAKPAERVAGWLAGPAEAREVVAVTLRRATEAVVV